MPKQYLAVLCLVLYTFFLDGGKFYTVDYFAAISKFYTVDLAGICWSIWNCHNRATFEFNLPRSPFEIVFASCATLMSWVGLEKAGDSNSLRYGGTLLKSNATIMLRICAAITRHVDLVEGFYYIEHLMLSLVVFARLVILVICLVG